MLRVIDIVQVLIKYRIDEYLFRDTSTRFIFKTATGFRNLFNVPTVSGGIGTRLRLALQELGPVFIKFGQIAASRPDIIPQHLTKELSMLRDNVEPFAFEQVQQIVENELQQPISTTFSQFDTMPVAAGSVAQVHLAQLINGEQVAVKVLRPQIRDTILQDVQLFKQIVSLIEMYKNDFKQFKLHAVIDELSNSILQELDLVQESKNIEKFASGMQDCTYVHVPKVFKATSQVLIMQRMYGVPIDQIQKEQNIDVKKVITQGVEALLLQVFRNGFFHADQHAGNLWIESDGSRVYLDFGIVGELNKTDRELLLKILFYLYGKNYTKVTSTIIEAGWVKHISDQSMFETDLGAVSSMFVGKQQKDFSLGHTLNQLIKTFKNYEVQVPTQYTLLAKTIIQIEGTSKLLAPDLNLEKVVLPILIKHFAKKA